MDQEPRHEQHQEPSREKSSADPERRHFLSSVSGAGMTAALIASYGSCAAMGGRFLYPAQATRRAWQFVARADEVENGGTLEYRAPDGSSITIARQGSRDEAESFVALSSVCPHLGCQVTWQSAHQRFFCPCHNGAFDAQGQPIQGPPADAGQELERYPLKVENQLLYIEVPVGEAEEGRST